MIGRDLSFRLRLALAVLLGLAILVIATGCSGSGPTAPEGQASITTAYGVVSVWSDGSAYEPATIRAALERGQRRALAQRPDVPSLNGLTVAVYRQQVWRGVDSVGAYDEAEDVVSVLSGIEDAADHELQHRAAWKLGHRGDCYMLQDHSPGFDLACRPR